MRKKKKKKVDLSVTEIVCYNMSTTIPKVCFY